MNPLTVTQMVLNVIDSLDESEDTGPVGPYDLTLESIDAEIAAEVAEKKVAESGK